MATPEEKAWNFYNENSDQFDKEGRSKGELVVIGYVAGRLDGIAEVATVGIQKNIIKFWQNRNAK
mgnify:CR=1 FL=1